MGGLYEYIKMAVQNIRANKGRSFLTMLGIIIGIASVIAIVSIGEEKVPSATEDLKEKMLTSVESFPTTILAFWSPINAIKRPIPTDTACFRFIGMELKIASRTLVRESRIKMIPSANTAASACCQEYPIPRTTV